MPGKTRGKGEGSIYLNSRGLWTAVIELPSHDGRQRRRKFIRSKTRATVVQKLREMQNDLDLRGDLPTAEMTVEAWLVHWIEDIAIKTLRPKTAAGYRTVIYNHVIPVIGKTKLNKVTPNHLRQVEERITDELGLSSTYALNAHRIMSKGFEVALREGKLGRNPGRLMDAPLARVPVLDAFTLEESIEVLRHVSHDPLLGARWATSLLTGARRGEVIGLERDRVGGRDDVLDFSWQLQRLVWEHGCGAFRVVDGKRVWPCRSGQGNTCPDRRLRRPANHEMRQLTNGLYLTRPKTKGSTRVVPLVDPLRSIVHHHLDVTPANEYGLVFTWAGRPTDPDQDTARWNEVLAATGIAKAVRLHDLRHTAVDLLTLAGVPDNVIMEIVGHSQRATTQAYRSRNVARLRAAMEQMSALFTTPVPERDELA